MLIIFLCKIQYNKQTNALYNLTKILIIIIFNLESSLKSSNSPSIFMFRGTGLPPKGD